jgi:hypothetical protein
MMGTFFVSICPVDSRQTIIFLNIFALPGPKLVSNSFDHSYSVNTISKAISLGISIGLRYISFSPSTTYVKKCVKIEFVYLLGILE